jgi:hypothetical protein
MIVFVILLMFCLSELVTTKSAGHIMPFAISSVLFVPGILSSKTAVVGRVAHCKNVTRFTAAITMYWRQSLVQKPKEL